MNTALYTTREYPCGCKAEGPGDVPAYCDVHAAQETDFVHLRKLAEQALLDTSAPEHERDVAVGALDLLSLLNRLQKPSDRWKCEYKLGAYAVRRQSDGYEIGAFEHYTATLLVKALNEMPASREKSTGDSNG